MNNTPVSKFLTMTASPHIKSPIKTKNIMLDVIIALMPALFWSIYVFGPRSLVLTFISVISCVVSLLNLLSSLGLPDGLEHENNNGKIKNNDIVLFIFFLLFLLSIFYDFMIIFSMIT